MAAVTNCHIKTTLVAYSNRNLFFQLWRSEFQNGFRWGKFWTSAGFLPPSSESATAGWVPLSFLSLTSAFIATSPLTLTHVCLRRTLGITLNPPRESRGISPFSRSLLSSAKSLLPWKLTRSQLWRIRTAHLWGYGYSSSGHTWFLSSLWVTTGHHYSRCFTHVYSLNPHNRPMR